MALRQCRSFYPPQRTPALISKIDIEIHRRKIRMPAFLNLSLVKAKLGDIMHSENAPVWHATSVICTPPLFSNDLDDRVCPRSVWRVFGVNRHRLSELPVYGVN